MHLALSVNVAVTLGSAALVWCGLRPRAARRAVSATVAPRELVACAD
jgi:hypothetical protein